jgi:hypothetical protein
MSVSGIGFQFDPEAFKPLIDQAVEAAIVRLDESRAGLRGNGPAIVPPLLALRPREAAKALGISPRLLWDLTRNGVVPCVRVGTGKRQTVLYPVVGLEAWLTGQPETSKKPD